MKKIGHYSGFSVSNGFGFTSGIIGADADGWVVAGIKSQVSTAIDALQNLLSNHGLNMSSVIKTTVYITNNSDYPAMDEAYKQAFGVHSPARTTIIVAALPHVASDGPETILFEIEAIVAFENLTKDAV